MMSYAILAALMLAADQPASNPHDSLPQFDESRITVSGVSSGGYMAMQLHLAYPEVFSGAGLVAAGPYGCAQGSLMTALGNCMGKATEAPPVDALLKTLSELVDAGQAGDSTLIQDAPVWILRGSRDEQVAAPVSAAAAEMYRQLGADVTYIDDQPFAHHFPTLEAGAPCDESAVPFLGACGFDAAGEILMHIAGAQAGARGDKNSEIRSVPVPEHQSGHLMPDALVYVPQSCTQQGADCGLHLVLHGCAQSAQTIDRQFVEGAGYREWADAAELMIMFPQVTASPANPYACWDWWGYTGENYLTRDAAQMSALRELVRAVAH